MKSFTLALSMVAILGLAACSHGTCTGTAYAGTSCNVDKGAPMMKKNKADATMSKSLRK